MSELAQGPQGMRGPKGDTGAKGEAGESRLIGTAEAMVGRLIKADRARQWQIRILGIACAVLLVVAAFTVIGYFQNQSSATALRQQSITNCENNNKFRAAQVSSWVKNYGLQAQEDKATAKLLQQLIAALVNGDSVRVREVNAILAESSAASRAEIREFLHYVSVVDAPKNCQELYAAATPAPAPASSAKAMVLYSEPDQLANWNGFCLSSRGDKAGARIYEAPCTSLNWLYYPALGQLRPAGNTKLAAGFSGGRLELISASDTRHSTVNENDFAAGPDGYMYARLFLLGVRNSYLHAGGDGKNVGLTGRSSRADYWVFLSYGNSVTANKA